MTGEPRVIFPYIQDTERNTNDFRPHPVSASKEELPPRLGPTTGPTRRQMAQATPTTLEALATADDPDQTMKISEKQSNSSSGQSPGKNKQLAAEQALAHPTIQTPGFPQGVNPGV